MTSLQQDSKLQRLIWAIDNDAHSSVGGNGWDFKQYGYYRDLLLSFPRSNLDEVAK